MFLFFNPEVYYGDAKVTIFFLKIKRLIGINQAGLTK